MKNKYNLPRKPISDKNESDAWCEDDYYKACFHNVFSYEDENMTEDEDDEEKIKEDDWLKNGIKPDVYHLPGDKDDYVQDPYTVRQNFQDRTQFPL